MILSLHFAEYYSNFILVQFFFHFVALDDFEVSGKVSAPTSMEAGFNKVIKTEF